MRSLASHHARKASRTLRRVRKTGDPKAINRLAIHLFVASDYISADPHNLFVCYPDGSALRVHDSQVRAYPPRQFANLCARQGITLQTVLPTYAHQDPLRTLSQAMSTGLLEQSLKPAPPAKEAHQ